MLRFAGEQLQATTYKKIANGGKMKLGKVVKDCFPS
jgi:hypothetical protein